MIPTGILTVSDRAAAGEYADLGGPALASAVRELGWEVQAAAVVPDDPAAIQDGIRSMVAAGCQLVLTTGGTGIGPRDVTPEAILGMGGTIVPGFGEAMRLQSFPTVPTSILSRSLAAVVGTAFVIALPGKPAGAVESLRIVAPAVPHAVRLIRREPDRC